MKALKNSIILYENQKHSELCSLKETHFRELGIFMAPNCCLTGDLLINNGKCTLLMKMHLTSCYHLNAVITLGVTNSRTTSLNVPPTQYKVDSLTYGVFFNMCNPNVIKAFELQIYRYTEDRGTNKAPRKKDPKVQNWGIL